MTAQTRAEQDRANEHDNLDRRPQPTQRTMFSGEMLGNPQRWAYQLAVHCQMVSSEKYIQLALYRLNRLCLGIYVYTIYTITVYEKRGHEFQGE